MTSKQHHRAKAPGPLVEQIRAEYEGGIAPIQLSRKYEISINTIYDWVYYRTRQTADLE